MPQIVENWPITPGGWKQKVLNKYKIESWKNLSKIEPLGFFLLTFCIFFSSAKRQIHFCRMLSRNQLCISLWKQASKHSWFFIISNRDLIHVKRLILWGCHLYVIITFVFASVRSASRDHLHLDVNFQIHTNSHRGVVHLLSSI